jgi:hypothetical protein
MVTCKKEIIRPRTGGRAGDNLARSRQRGGSVDMLLGVDTRPAVTEVLIPQT